MTPTSSETTSAATDVVHANNSASANGTNSDARLVNSSHRPATEEKPFVQPGTAAATQPMDLPLGKIIFALPAYNEADSLAPLLARINRAMLSMGREFHVVVVNDGSQDDTGRIASQYSFHMDLTLVDHVINRGFGAAVESALRKADELAGEHDIIVTMDADNTQPPESIHRMVDLIDEGYDVIIASRYRTGARVIGVPWRRNIYSLGARLMFTCLFPTRGVRDYTCGFRAIRATLIRNALSNYGQDMFSEDGFSATVDLLLKLRRLPGTTLFHEVPLILRYDQKGGVSKMNVPRTIVKTLKLMARRKFRR